MSAVILDHAVILTPMEVLPDCSLVASEEGKIAYIGKQEYANRYAGEHLDLNEKILIPGLIDIHVHGGNGISFDQHLRAEDLISYSEWVASCGVTGFLCSIAAPTHESLINMIAGYVTILEDGLPGAQCLGLHLEGPFLNPQKKGAFPITWLRVPMIDQAMDFIEAGRGWIRQVTIAPELPGAEEVATMLRANGVTASLGHSNADYETARRVLNGLFEHVTHTFNAQSGFNHRQPGVFGAILASDFVTAELIADLVHVHPGAMRVLHRCLGSDRVVLITDAISGAGLDEGSYNLGDILINVRQGKATLQDGTIAGSTAILNQCVRNIHRELGLSLAEAVRMASLNPANVIGLGDRLGSLTVGKDASLVVIDSDINVILTMVGGKIIYRGL